MKIREFIVNVGLEDSDVTKVSELFRKLKSKYSKKYDKVEVVFCANTCEDYLSNVYCELYGTREETDKEIRKRKKYLKERKKLQEVFQEEYNKKYGVKIPL